MRKSGIIDNLDVANAYAHILIGRSDNNLYDMYYSKTEIEKAKEFRDNFQHRDMFASVLAQEMGISVPLARKLQRIYSEHQARCIIGAH